MVPVAFLLDPPAEAAPALVSSLSWVVRPRCMVVSAEEMGFLKATGRLGVLGRS